MNKWQIICPLALFAIMALAGAVILGLRQHYFYIIDRSEMIAEGFLAGTNSPLLAPIDPALRERLLNFSGTTRGEVEVRLGDEPAPIGDGSACSRLILSSPGGGSIGIRLRQGESEKFHVLGYWTITEPDPRPDPGSAAAPPG